MQEWFSCINRKNWVMVGLAIIGISIFILNKRLNDVLFSLRIWGMVVILIFLIGYTAFSFVKGASTKELNRQYYFSKIYWCFWILCCTVAVNQPDDYTIKVYGINPFGISETIWLLCVWGIAGILIYIFIFSDKKIKSVSKDGVEFEGIEAISENMDAQFKALEDIKKNVASSYDCLGEILQYAHQIKGILENQEIENLSEVIRNVVKKYADKQEYINDVFVGCIDEVKNKYKVTEEVLENLKNSSCHTIFKKGKEEAFLIPFKSELFEFHVIGLELSEAHVGIEQHLILTLLEIFEEVILA